MYDTLDSFLRYPNAETIDTINKTLHGQNVQLLEHCLFIFLSLLPFQRPDHLHLENSRFRAKYLSKDQKLVMLPAVLVDSYLDRLAKSSCDVFHEKLKQRDPKLPLVLYWKKFRQTY